MSGRVVPLNGHILIHGLQDVQTHLEELNSNDNVQINAKLFDDVEMQVTESNSAHLLPILLPPLTQLIKSTSQDPTPALALATKILSPLSYSDTLKWTDVPSLIAALESPLPGASLLALAVLHKAARKPAEARLLLEFPEIWPPLIRTWLHNPDTGVGERTSRVLGDILETECRWHHGTNGTAPRPRPPRGEGVLWDILFRDETHLTLIKRLCDPEDPEPSPETQRSATIAQGRLLRLLPRLAALNCAAVTSGRFANVVEMPRAVMEAVGPGLLQWAALCMVSKHDRLMHLNLIDFFETFVSIMRVANVEQNFVKSLVQAATRNDPEIKQALRALPDKTIAEESESLRAYVNGLLD